ncbi:MAG: sensor histidine kinase [Caulobacterales bacterium]
MSSTVEETRGSFARVLREPRRALLWALFLVAYALLDRLSQLFLPSVGALTPWDLAGGLALGFLLLEGPGAAVLVALADFADDFLVPGARPPTHDLILAAIGGAASYALAAAWLRGEKSVRLTNQRDLVRLALAAAAATLAHVSLDVELLGHWSLAGGRSWPAELGSAWTGAFVGALVVAPLFMLPAMNIKRLRAGAALEAALVAASLVAALSLTFPGLTDDRFRYFYILFLPQVWVAVRYGVQGAVLGNLFVQIGLMSFFIVGSGPREMIFAYQFRFLALASTILFLGVAVTERRGFETALRQRQEEMARVSRLSLAGEMAAALAHQLNQPLMAAMAFTRSAQRLLRKPGEADTEGASQAMDEAVAQAERAAAIVRSLREFIGRSATASSAVSFAALVREAVQLVEPDCALAGVRIATAIDQQLPKVQADAVQVQQVLINLIHNAIDSLADTSGPRQITIEGRLSPDGEMEAEVRDTGPGVAPLLEPRLFEPFATAKTRGMGLGLTVCRGLIEAHGGRLWLAENRPGRCAFRFTLPLAKTRGRQGGAGG